MQTADADRTAARPWSVQSAVLPPKVVKKNLALEFVEMSELRADVWPEDLAPADTPSTPRPGRPPVINIKTWLECFARLAVVLVSWFPEKGPELWAYPSTILNAAHSYEGATWVTYDRQFRREMLAWKDLNWSVPNSRLYNEAFTGRAKIMQRCQHCLLEDHGSTGCPQHPNPMLVGWFHPPVSLPQLASLAAAVPTPPSTSPKTPGAEVCRNFHADRCRFSRCLFVHSCSDCAGPPELPTLAGSTSIAGAAAQPAFQKGPQQPPVPPVCSATPKPGALDGIGPPCTVGERTPLTVRGAFLGQHVLCQLFRAVYLCLLTQSFIIYPRSFILHHVYQSVC